MNKFVNMYDLIYCISKTGDLINNEITNHHKKVAYMAFRIAEGFGLSKEQQREVFRRAASRSGRFFSFGKA